jgi:hypothetical protein
MAGAVAARMAAAIPLMSACFDVDTRVFKPGICQFSCSLFARLKRGDFLRIVIPL